MLNGRIIRPRKQHLASSYHIIVRLATFVHVPPPRIVSPSCPRPHEALDAPRIIRRHLDFVPRYYGSVVIFHESSDVYVIRHRRPTAIGGIDLAPRRSDPPAALPCLIGRRCDIRPPRPAHGANAHLRRREASIFCIHHELVLEYVAYHRVRQMSVLIQYRHSQYQLVRRQ